MSRRNSSNLERHDGSISYRATATNRSVSLWRCENLETSSRKPTGALRFALPESRPGPEPPDHGAARQGLDFLSCSVVLPFVLYVN